MTTAQGRHLFLVGTGRCGSSISYSCLAMHPEFAWLSTWLTLLPALPAVTLANRIWGIPGMDRFREARFFPKPAEPNTVFQHWDRHFPVEDATPDALAMSRRILPALVDRICRAQGRTRFLGKLVGRPVKIDTLARVFPDAHFVHVTRPLRPSTASLLHVEFYDARALDQWPWRAVPPAYLDFYRSRASPREIAAAIVIQANMLELERQLGDLKRDRWIELPYGDFVADPVTWIRTVGDHAGFTVDTAYVARLHRRQVYAGADDKWKKVFTPAELKNLDDFEAMAGQSPG
jgi:hypothetical protein